MIVGHQPRKGSEIMNRSISSCLERQIERLLHYYYFCAIFINFQKFKRANLTKVGTTDFLQKLEKSGWMNEKTGWINKLAKTWPLKVFIRKSVVDQNYKSTSIKSQLVANRLRISASPHRMSSSKNNIAVKLFQSSNKENPKRWPFVFLTCSDTSGI